MFSTEEYADSILTLHGSVSPSYGNHLSQKSALRSRAIFLVIANCDDKPYGLRVVFRLIVHQGCHEAVPDGFGYCLVSSFLILHQVYDMGLL